MVSKNQPNELSYAFWLSIICGFLYVIFTVALQPFKAHTFKPVAKAQFDQYLLISSLYNGAFGVLWASIWMFGALGAHAKGKLVAWRLAFVSFTFVLFFSLFAEHEFFTETGTYLSWSLVNYALHYATGIAQFAANTPPSTFITSICGVIAPVALAWWFARYGEEISPRQKWLLPSLLLSGALFVYIFIPRLSSMYTPLTSQLVLKATNHLKVSAPREIRPVYSSLVTESVPSRRPNIVMIVLESTRADLLPPNSRPETRQLLPNLHSFADQSLSYSWAFSSIDHTSHALVGIHCGMYPPLETIAIYAVEGFSPLQCIPKLLQSHGYQTAYAQSVVGHFENRVQLVKNLGFEHFAVRESFSQDVPESAWGIGEEHMVEPLGRWIENVKEPFFLSILTISTHHPYVIPGVEPIGDEPTKERYWAAANYVDQFFGKLIDRLQRTPAWENTVVILVGDHGQAFGEHQLMLHNGIPYNESMQVPLILGGPALQGLSGVRGGNRSQVDVLPTIQDLLGLPAFALAPGKSLLDEEGHDELFAFCYQENICAVRLVGNFKYIYWFESGEVEVYELASDPFETNNIADQIDRTEIEQSAMRILDYKASIDAFYEGHKAKGAVVEHWVKSKAKNAAFWMSNAKGTGLLELNAPVQ